MQLKDAKQRAQEADDLEQQVPLFEARAVFRTCTLFRHGCLSQARKRFFKARAYIQVHAFDQACAFIQAHASSGTAV